MQPTKVQTQRTVVRLSDPSEQSVLSSKLSQFNLN